MPVLLGEDALTSFLFILPDDDIADDKCKKSIDVGNEAGARIFRGTGSVDELYDELIDGTIDGERPSDGDLGATIVRLVGDEERRRHRRRLSQSLIRPCDTLINCSFSTRNDGRTSGQCAQHFLIT